MGIAIPPLRCGLPGDLFLPLLRRQSIFDRAAPSSLPSCCAGLGAGVSSRLSGSSPVAIRMPLTAPPITSEGRFLPLGSAAHSTP